MRRFHSGGVALALLMSACNGTTSATPVTTTTTTTTTKAATTTAPPTTTTLSSRDLFTLVSPSLAFISTDLSTGSGVLFDEGLIVTNAHVVWPYDEVRVVFPDGTEILDAPVLGIDTYTDLALIGPVEVDAPVLPLATGQDARVGDTVYLVGYPGEVEDFPTPAVTRGLVSRLRTWQEASITLIQTDALISGGQSGGALVSEDGRLMGISGLSFTPDGFALAAGSADLAPRIAAIREGRIPERFADTGPQTGPPATDHTVALEPADNAAVFEFEEPLDTTVDFTSAGDHPTQVGVVDGYGYPMFGFDPTSGEALIESSGSVTTDVTGPFFILAGFTEPVGGSMRLTTSVEVRLVDDPDDGITIRRGSRVEGNMDYPGDADIFPIELAAGESVTVAVESLLDAELWIDDLQPDEDLLAYDSDSGGGVLGLNPRLEFTAERAGTYYFAVQVYDFFAPGGYILTVE